MIDLSESEVKSGAPVERPVTVGDQQGGVTTSLLSPLSSLVSPDYNVWNIVQAVVRQLLRLTTTTYTPLIGLYGLFAAFRNISGETGTAVTIQL